MILTDRIKEHKPDIVGCSTLLNRTMFLELSREMLLHGSSWTDLSKILRVFSDTTIELGLNPEKFIQSATYEEMKAKLQEVYGLCQEFHPKAFTISLNGLDVMGDWLENLTKINYWCGLAKKLSFKT